MSLLYDMIQKDVFDTTLADNTPEVPVYLGNSEESPIGDRIKVIESNFEACEKALYELYRDFDRLSDVVRHHPLECNFTDQRIVFTTQDEIAGYISALNRKIEEFRYFQMNRIGLLEQQSQSDQLDAANRIIFNSQFSSNPYMMEWVIKRHHQDVLESSICTARSARNLSRYIWKTKETI